MKKLLIVVMAMALSGCASVQCSRLSNEQQPKLDPEGSAYVLVPANAMYFTKECIGTGRIIASLIYSNFSKHLKRVKLAPEGEKLEEGLKKAKDSGFVYLVDSKILRWEDHVTEWNDQVDQIDMQMDIYDVQVGRLIDSVEFVGHGTLNTLGGYHPQHILKESMPKYINSLFLSIGDVKEK